MARIASSLLLLLLLMPTGCPKRRAFLPLARQRFELQQSVTVALATKEYAETLEHLRAPALQDCTPAWLAEPGHSSECVYHPPFPARLSFSLSPNLPSIFPQSFSLLGPKREPVRVVPVFSWAPASETAEGERILLESTIFAESADTFNCQNAQCKVVVHALSAAQKQARETVLALCEIYKLGETFGAPEDCVPALISATRGRTTTTLVSIVSGYKVGESPPLPGFDLELSIQPSPELSAVVAQAEKALKAPRLELEPQPSPFPGVAIGLHQGTSKVLSPFREQVIVRVQAMKYAGNLIGVSYGTTLYVNRQNTDRNGDWHRPEPRQLDDYNRELKNNLRKFLEAFCKTPQWQNGDSVLVCPEVSKASL